MGAIGITQSLVDAFFMRNGQRPIIGYNSDGSPKVNPDANYSETGFSTQKETYSTKWQYGSSEGDRNKDGGAGRGGGGGGGGGSNGILVVREILTFIWMVKTVVPLTTLHGAAIWYVRE